MRARQRSLASLVQLAEARILFSSFSHPTKHSSRGLRREQPLRDRREVDQSAGTY